MLVAIVIWFVLALIIGVAAARRGRSGLGWVFLSLMLSPLFAAIVLALLPDRRYGDALSQLSVYQAAAAADPDNRRDHALGCPERAN